MLRQLLFAALVATAFAEPPDASWTKTLKAVLAEPVHITSLAYHNRDGALRWIGFTPRNRVVFPGQAPTLTGQRASTSTIAIAKAATATTCVRTHPRTCTPTASNTNTHVRTTQTVANPEVWGEGSELLAITGTAHNSESNPYYRENPVWGCAAACYNNETSNNPSADVKTGHRIEGGEYPHAWKNQPFPDLTVPKLNSSIERHTGTGKTAC